jgi:hypothetical protein
MRFGGARHCPSHAVACTRSRGHFHEFGGRKSRTAGGTPCALAHVMSPRQRHLDAQAGQGDTLGCLALTPNDHLALGYWPEREGALSPCRERGQSREPVEDRREFENVERALVRAGTPLGLNRL